VLAHFRVQKVFYNGIVLGCCFACNLLRCFHQTRRLIRFAAAAQKTVKLTTRLPNLVLLKSAPLSCALQGLQRSEAEEQHRVRNFPSHPGGSARRIQARNRSRTSQQHTGRHGKKSRPDCRLVQPVDTSDLSQLSNRDTFSLAVAGRAMCSSGTRASCVY